MLFSQIIALSDINSQWSEGTCLLLTWAERSAHTLPELGLSQDLSAMGMGKRPLRYALILDDLKVVSVEVSHWSSKDDLGSCRPLTHLFMVIGRARERSYSYGCRGCTKQAVDNRTD